MKNIKIIIEYDGTKYHGWQTQQNAKTVQDTIESAFLKLTNEKIKLNGSSRTDEGVHSLGLVANFTTTTKIPDNKISYALNSVLPNDIVIKKSEEVSLDFHARFSAKGKVYKYLILNADTPSAININRAYFIKQPLDIESMKYSAQFFKGTYDFSSFKSVGGSAKTSIRTIWESEIFVHDEIIQYRISGDGFLYNMVRIIMGTLIEVGRNKIDKDSILRIIESKDRKLSGPTSPPFGLYLEKVIY